MGWWGVMGDIVKTWKRRGLWWDNAQKVEILCAVNQAATALVLNEGCHMFSSEDIDTFKNF